MVEYPKPDVFLAHNSQEKAKVEKIREQLKQRGIYAWLDKYDFEPFRRWQEQLGEIIPQIKAVAIFIGSSGVGPWQDIEMSEFLGEFAKRQIRMGLVILPGCPDEIINTVPIFMQSFQRVDFRQLEPDPMEQLIWGITGVKPKPSPSLQVVESDVIEVKPKPSPSIDLSGQQRKKIQFALINAFPTLTSLEQMLAFGLDKNLRAIAGEGSLQDIVFKLIQAANSEGWVEDLVRVARDQNPGNSQLRIIAEEVLNYDHEAPPNNETENVSQGAIPVLKKK